MTIGPRFTIVVPAFNAERTLAAALASVEQQTERDLEVVVVDDGSRDGTGELADRLCEPRGWRVVHQANGGLPNARNAALRIARGRYVALLDADDWILPDFLTRLGQLLESAPDVGLAFGDAWTWYASSRRFGRRSAMARYRPARIPTEPGEFFELLLQQNFVYGAAAMPRAVLESLGGFNEGLRAAEDWNLWLRIVASGHRAAQTPERLAVYRRHEGQMTSEARRMREGVVAALLDVRDSCPLSGAPAAALERRIAAATASVDSVDEPPPVWRGPLKRFAWPALWLRDHRFTAPEEVVARFPELRR